MHRGRRCSPAAPRPASPENPWTSSPRPRRRRRPGPSRCCGRAPARARRDKLTEHAALPHLRALYARSSLPDVDTAPLPTGARDTTGQGRPPVDFQQLTQGTRTFAAIPCPDHLCRRIDLGTMDPFPTLPCTQVPPRPGPRTPSHGPTRLRWSHLEPVLRSVRPRSPKKRLARPRSVVTVMPRFFGATTGDGGVSV